jgi:hypothetical protein
MKRLLALVAGGLGLAALLKRRSRRAEPASPADDLRAKLAQTKGSEEPPEPAAETVDDRRADVHARAREAIDELGES